jgi:hypothetical protein
LYEFTWTGPWVVDMEPTERSRYAAKRMKRLASIAETLQQNGWTVWMTMTGLAFAPPPGEVPEAAEDEWEDPYDQQLWLEEEVAALLSELGIDDEFCTLVGKMIPEMPDGVSHWMWGVP